MGLVAGAAAGAAPIVERGAAQSTAAGYGAVVLLDPPAGHEQLALIPELATGTRVHAVWGAAEVEFARSVVESRHPLRPALAAVWRAAREGVTPLLPAATVSRCLRVLEEVGIDLPRPRTREMRDTPEFLEFRRRLRMAVDRAQSDEGGRDALRPISRCPGAAGSARPVDEARPTSAEIDARDESQTSPRDPAPGRSGALGEQPPLEADRQAAFVE